MSEQLPVRGIYGGVPRSILEAGKTLADYGINAVWIGSGSLKTEDVALLKKQGAQVFAEFNTLHEAGFLREHPDAAPIGPDGQICPPPDDWQGVCPTHPGYRRYRMDAFRAALSDFALDGIWLDYHHAHASWEQAVPNLPDTCFCPRCLDQFARETGQKGLGADVLLGTKRSAWTAWRCQVFTDWVREMAAIRDEVRPGALLGTFHCPWTERERGGALRHKLAIDLRAQAAYIDVFSIMPYHARFGHASDPAWIARQTAWLGQHLRIAGTPGEKKRIWPIVQLSDWGERVAASDVERVLGYGARRPATGVTVFAWGGLSPEKIEALGRFYRG